MDEVERKKAMNESMGKVLVAVEGLSVKDARSVLDHVREELLKTPVSKLSEWNERIVWLNELSTTAADSFTLELSDAISQLSQMRRAL